MIMSVESNTSLIFNVFGIVSQLKTKLWRIPKEELRKRNPETRTTLGISTKTNKTKKHKTENIRINKFNILTRVIYIQYWCIDAKYIICVERLKKGGKIPSHIHIIFTVITPMLYLSCNN